MGGGDGLQNERAGGGRGVGREVAEGSGGSRDALLPADGESERMARGGGKRHGRTDGRSPVERLHRQDRRSRIRQHQAVARGSRGVHRPHGG